MSNLITIDASKSLGSQVVQVNDMLVQLFSASDVLSAKTAQSVGDDATGAQLMALVGANSLVNALLINNLLGSLKTDLNNGANSFLGYKSRVTRA